MKNRSSIAYFHKAINHNAPLFSSGLFSAIFREQKLLDFQSTGNLKITQAAIQFEPASLIGIFLRKASPAFLYFLLIQMPVAVYGQRKNPGWWQMYTAEAGLNHRWSIRAEGQVRSQKMLSGYNLSSMGTSVSYKLYQSISILSGINYISVYSSGGNFKKPVLNNEFRFFEQIASSNSIGRVKIESRLRLEQRWRTTGYASRARVRVSSMAPLNKTQISKGTMYVMLREEVFWGGRLPNDEYNCLQGGLGYQFSQTVRWEIAWVHQYRYEKSRTNLIQTMVSVRLKTAS